MVSTDVLDKVKELAEALTPVPDMAILLGMPESKLRVILDDPENEICQVFRKTLAEVSLKIRKRDLELSEAGSPTAAEAVTKHLSKMRSSL